MRQLFTTLVQVVAVVGVTLGIFLAANAVLDLARRSFTLYATLAGAAIGAPLGALANSGGWFLGGPLWAPRGAAEFRNVPPHPFP